MCLRVKSGVSSSAKNHRLLVLKVLAALFVVALLLRAAVAVRKVRLNALFKAEAAAGDDSKALETGSKLAWYEPADLNLAIAMADLAMKKNDRSGAAKILQGISGRLGDSISENIRLGLKFQEVGMLDKALVHLQFGLEREPRNLDAQRTVAAILGIERRETEQERALWSWYRSGKSAVEALRLLAQWEVVIPPGTIPKTSDEGQILERQLSIEKDSVHAAAALAFFYRNRGELEKAAGLIDQMLKKEPDDLSLIAEKLAELIESGDGVTASSLIDVLGGRLEKSPQLLWLRGDYFRSRGEYKNAIKDYESGLKLGGRNPKIYFKLSECCRIGGLKSEYEINLKKYQETRQVTYDAAAIDFNNPDIGLMLKVAGACDRLERKAESIAWAREVLRRDQSNLEARKIIESKTDK